VYIAVLALLSCVGAWSAWRHHPLYSARSTLRIGGEMLLLVGAAICILGGTLHLLEGRSQPVQFAAVMVMVVLVTIGMILGIMIITTPACARVHAPLPAQARVTSHRRALLPWAKFAVVCFAACGLLALIPGPVRYLTGAFALIGALLCCVMFPVGYFAARQRDLAVGGVLLEPSLHWQYSVAAWTDWSAAQVARLKAAPTTFIFRRDWRKLAGISAALLLGSWLFGYGTLPQRLGWAVLCDGVLIGLVELAAWDAHRTPQRLQRHLQAAPRDAWFGEAGLLCGGEWLPWLDQSVYLTSATLDARAPRSILFSFDKLVPGAYGAPGLVHVSQGVPIPADAPATDLALLQSALTRRCPSARVALA
jgi:hypothetical protein